MYTFPKPRRTTSSQISMAINFPCRTSLPSKHHLHLPRLFSTRHSTSLRASRRINFDDFSSRDSSYQLWRDFWRTANEDYEQLAYETQKLYEKFDRKFAVSRRFADVAESAKYRAKWIDNDLRITEKWSVFVFDFKRIFPLYWKRIIYFFDSTTPGRLILTISFLWFWLSGWLFRVLAIAIWVLPFGPPLIVAVFNNILFVKGSCPACKWPYVGFKFRTVRCPAPGCYKIVWQPQSTSPFSSSKSDIIDVEFEEK